MKATTISLNGECPRCAGTGSVSTSMFNGKCFWCQGKGALSQQDIEHIVRYHTQHPQHGKVIVQEVELDWRRTRGMHSPYDIDVRISKANHRLQFRVHDCKSPKWQQVKTTLPKLCAWIEDKELSIAKALETKKSWTFYFKASCNQEGLDFATVMRAGQRMEQVIEQVLETAGS